MSERAAPFYCPYCGDEDLRPSEQTAASPPTGHGHRSGGSAWECAACNRGFQLKFLGLLARGVSRGSARSAPQANSPDEGGLRHSDNGGDDRT
ncbi:hypothetical protein ACFC09_02180 [Streptomyces sp. NPDC056161]|uniref:hypothetical protein n=1 Tax=Streptomyces sp. NPDC056161 TaxID=3345732 RepID=UPI0035DCBF10